MPLADAAVMGFLAPVIVAAMSPILLGEPTSRAVFISLPLAFLGVLMVTKPPAVFGTGSRSPTLSVLAIAVGLSQSFSSAGVKLIIRYLGKTEPVVSIVFAMAALSTIGSAVLCAVVPSQHLITPARPRDWVFLGGVGVCAIGVQMAQTTALKYTAAAPVVVMSYSAIIWSMLLDGVAFGDTPTLSSFFGALLVAGASLLLLSQEKGKQSALPPREESLLPEKAPLLVELPSSTSPRHNG